MFVPNSLLSCLVAYFAKRVCTGGNERMIVLKTQISNIANSVLTSILRSFLIGLIVLPLFLKIYSKTPVDKENTYILAIESSCDDTSAAVLCNNKKLSNVVASQKVHEAYGGIVPELASRAHQQNIVPVVHQALSIANIDKKELSAIAFTRGPGLLGSLLVGTSFAKSLSLGLDIPLIEVNHMQAHILAHFIEEEDMREPNFPFLALDFWFGKRKGPWITVFGMGID